MMLRPRDERGAVDMGWLKSQHSFSFGHYHDPKHMGFGPLRVINEDRVIGGAGFGTHPHDNMEIVSYVLSGALEHKDSLGTGSIIRAGDLQRMSAGTGVTHSEYNHAQDESVHFLQIWFLPKVKNIAPSYAQKTIKDQLQQGQFTLVMSETGREGSMTLNADVEMYVGLLAEGQSAEIKVQKNRLIWVQVAKGQVHLNGRLLKAGDGAAVRDEERLVFDHALDAEVIVFDMAA